MGETRGKRTGRTPGHVRDRTSGYLASISYLSRDPFGIKPLYWRIIPPGILFSSEVRPLGSWPGALLSTREQSPSICTWGAMRADQSPFVGINGLPPNSVAAFQPDGRMVLEAILPHGPQGAPREPGELKVGVGGVDCLAFGGRRSQWRRPCQGALIPRRSQRSAIASAANWNALLSSLLGPLKMRATLPRRLRPTTDTTSDGSGYPSTA